MLTRPDANRIPGYGPTVDLTRFEREKTMTEDKTMTEEKTEKKPRVTRTRAEKLADLRAGAERDLAKAEGKVAKARAALNEALAERNKAQDELNDFGRPVDPEMQAVVENVVGTAPVPQDLSLVEDHEAIVSQHVPGSYRDGSAFPTVEP
jgi:hypothetical protein